MIRWNNDYNHGAHPAILTALEQTNETGYGGYGLDEWCRKASEKIQSYLGRADVDIHFLTGGTQANFTVISAALRPFQSVISADTGHINSHETGAVEHCGHKIHALKAADGKISAKQIRQEALLFAQSGTKEHITQPKLVYLSFPTEYGTIYSRQELTDIRSVCDEYNLYLMIDGARLGYGLGASTCDITLDDLASLADVFYIGGTKCGALFGEAVVIRNDDLKDNFRSYIKQNGGMLAKGWLLGLQFYTLFQNDMYFRITRKADEDAMKLKAAFRTRGIPFYLDSPTNQQFVLLTEEQMASLGQNHVFEYQFPVEPDLHCVRFCTSWSTKPEDLDALIRDIEAL